MQEIIKRRAIILIILTEIIIITYLLNKLPIKNSIRGMLTFLGHDDNQAEFISLITFMKDSEDPILHAELIPNHYQLFNGFTVKLNTTVIKINSDGFRDVEYTIEKPPNTIRIIALGDSFTFGWGVNLSDTYVKLLEKKLNEINTTINFQVMNFGVPGYNTLEEIELLKKKGLKYKPDIIIIGYTADDAFNNTKIKSGEITRKANEIVEELFGNSSKIPKEILYSHFSYQLLGEDLTINFDKNLENIVLSPLKELAKYKKELNLDVVIVFLTKVTFKEKEKIIEFSKNNEFCIIDAAEEIKKYGFNSIKFPSPDNHYNELGHKLVANIIFDNLINKCGIIHISST
jgi:lysophospholipase L1-like esterase